MSELKSHRWDANAKIDGLGRSAELLAVIVAAAPGAVEDVSGEIRSRFPEEIRDKIFDGFLKSVRSR